MKRSASEEPMGQTLAAVCGRLEGYADGLELLPVAFGGKQELIDGLRSDALKLAATLEDQEANDEQ